MIFVALGALCCALVVIPALRAPSTLTPRKTNFRGKELLATGGVGALAAAVGTVALGSVLSDEGAIRNGIAIFALGLLGLADDLFGDRNAGGFKGHLQSLRRGIITTGLIKAIGGGVVGLAFAFLVGRRGVELVVAGAVVALAANLINLFDLAPGRALKVWFPIAIGMALAWNEPSTWALLGAAAVLFSFDLKEQLMLGDVGSNAFGAAVGVSLASNASNVVLYAGFVVLLTINLAAEFVSYSSLIEKSSTLRRLDQIGRDP